MRGATAHYRQEKESKTHRIMHTYENKRPHAQISKQPKIMGAVEEDYKKEDKTENNNDKLFKAKEDIAKLKWD